MTLIFLAFPDLITIMVSDKAKMRFQGVELQSIKMIHLLDRIAGASAKFKS